MDDGRLGSSAEQNAKPTHDYQPVGLGIIQKYGAKSSNICQYPIWTTTQGWLVVSPTLSENMMFV